MRFNGPAMSVNEKRIWTRGMKLLDIFLYRGEDVDVLM